MYKINVTNKSLMSYCPKMKDRLISEPTPIRRKEKKISDYSFEVFLVKAFRELKQYNKL